MFGLFTKLPVTDEDRLWVDEGFRRLSTLLGRHRMLTAHVVEPTPTDFPDPWDATPAAAERMLRRICTFMQVDPSLIHFEIFPHEMDDLLKLLPEHRLTNTSRAAGFYVQNPDHPDHDRHSIAIRETQLRDPLALAATIAHELGHVILLGSGKLSPDTADHEPLTDLLTVFLGLGIFTANSAIRFRQYQDDRKQGWRISRLGYLPEQVFSYALARFAFERGESKPAWAQHLSTNVSSWFRSSLSWLQKNSSPIN